MTSDEMNELGILAMKVINNHPLTSIEEVRYFELEKELEKMDGVPTIIEEVLAGDGDGRTILAGRTSDDSNDLVESDGPDLRR